MEFDLKNKVALVTGGAQGLGLIYAKELLKNGLRGVTIADINEKVGESSVQELNKAFGANKAIFVKLDVRDKDQFDNAFKKTVEHFGNVDVLLNNAGILNDSIWEQQIQINVNGAINGIMLGIDKYLKDFKSDQEAVILNACSTAGVNGVPFIPIYSSTKFAVMGMTKSWGHRLHYERTKVRVIAICPGGADTSLMDLRGKHLGPEYEVPKDYHNPLQKPEHVGEQMIRILKKAPNGTLWVVENNGEPYEFVLPPRKSFVENKLV